VGCEFVLEYYIQIGTKNFRIVSVLKLLACSNRQASGLRVAVRVKFSEDVLDLKQSYNNKRNINKDYKYLIS